jgi:hypothetical protein
MIQGEVAALLQSPCSLIVGTVDASGLPAAARGMGLEVLDDGRRVRLLLSDAATIAIDNLRTTRRIALTGTEVATLVSYQVKGHAQSVEAGTEADARFANAYLDRFFRAVHDADGSEIAMLERLRPHGHVAVVFDVEEIYDQTPGPNAGRAISLAGA